MNQDHRTAFLAEIAKNPYDEANHLVFADWLEEHGYEDEAAEQRKWTKERQHAEDRIGEMAAAVDMEAVELIAAAEAYVSFGYYVTEFGSEHWRDYFHTVYEEFWQHYELLKEVKVEDKGPFFSCSC